MYVTDFAKVQSDYRREELSRSWAASHHRRTPWLRRAVRRFV